MDGEACFHPEFCGNQALGRRKPHFHWLLKKKRFFCGERRLAGCPVAERQVPEDFSHPSPGRIATASVWIPVAFVCRRGHSGRTERDLMTTSADITERDSPTGERHSVPRVQVRVLFRGCYL